MNGKKHLVVGFCSLLLASSAWAQNPTKYVKWDDGSKFYDAYQAWDNGKALYPGATEDEEFFISRVRMRERFRNQQTQVDKTRTQENDKNVFNWVPIGTTNNGNPNALPSGIFDSDVFSMWSYITHYGNWTAPLIRVPAAFTDAAHKNGVAVSALASIPWAAKINSYDKGHGQNLATMYRGGSDKFIKFLKYYGIDGWGMNSEFNAGASFATSLQNFMKAVYEKAITQKQLPSYVAAWYTLITNNGALGFNDGLANDNLSWYHKEGQGVSNYVFGNYNWGSSQLSSNDRLTMENGRDPREIYAGMNLQGAQGTGWTTLANSKTSVGLWGAHNMNMFFESRNEMGSSPEAQQATYLLRNERFFGNGNQNPAKKIEVKDGLGISASWLKSFHGISALSTAKSTLSWDLDQMPFYSFFNLGNGQFFNINGKKTFSGEWYNLGMQDYLPTWRYWFASSYLGSDVPENGLKATFTWKDAWFGGSCLEVSGTSQNEYLHLFKTKFALKDGDEIILRYKVASGLAAIKLVGSAEGSEASAVEVNALKSDAVDLDEWVEKKIVVGNSGRNKLKLADKTLAALALKFENAENLKFLLGEVTIKRGEVTAPQAPIINSNYTKVLARSYKGIDGKIVFSMARPSTLAEGEHIYNDDVKVSFYKLYVKQGDGEPVFATATTSWAGLYFAAPFDESKGNTVKFGVSAVGLDGKTESDITWSNDLQVSEKTIFEDIVIDKPVIKPNEAFTVKFIDPDHADATWTVVDKNGTTIHTATGQSFSHQLDQVGLYTLKVRSTFEGSSKEKTLGGFIQISDNAKGSVPKIETLTFNGETVTDESSFKTEANKQNNLAYTGKNSDGASSRGVALEEKPIGIKASDIGLTSQSASWTISLWVKFSNLNGTTQLLNVRNPSHSWPVNNWGAIWTTYDPASQILEITRRKSWSSGSNPEHKQRYKVNFAQNAWNHLTFVFEKKGDDAVAGRLYFNGEPAEATNWSNGDSHTEGSGLDQTGMPITESKPDVTFYFGGSAAGRAGVDGVVDNMKIYNKALTDAEVKSEMYSTSADLNGLLSFWNFEGDTESASFPSIGGSKSNAKLLWGEHIAGQGEGVAIFTPASQAHYEAGSPFINESKFKVTTTAEWVFPKGAITDATGTATAGSAKVQYKKDGVVSGKLILKNSWGTDTREIKMITVGAPTAIEEVSEAVALAAYPNPFVEAVNVRFDAAGQYEVAIYDLAGNLVSRRDANAQAGSVFTVGVDAPKGIYILRVQTKAGKLLKALKLQKN